MFPNASVDPNMLIRFAIWNAFVAISGIGGFDPRHSFADAPAAYLSESPTYRNERTILSYRPQNGANGNPIPSGSLHPSWSSVTSAPSHSPSLSPSEATCQYPILWDPRNTSILFKSPVPLLHNLQRSIHYLRGLTKTIYLDGSVGHRLLFVSFSSFSVYTTPLHRYKCTKLLSKPSVAEIIQTH